MDKYAASLYELLPKEKRAIFAQRYTDQEKTGIIGFFIAFMFGIFGVHMLYFRNAWGFAIYLLIALITIFTVGPFFTLLIWIVSMFHGALGANSANKKIADEIYATLK